MSKWRDSTGVVRVGGGRGSAKVQRGQLGEERARQQGIDRPCKQ